jgi:putative ABC transport system ATP-binding protein
MLQLDAVRKSFARPGGGTLPVLDGFTLALERGAFCAVMGPSGCGKSTLLMVCGGLLRPDAGAVRVAGKDLYGLGAEDRAALRARAVGFVFQQFHLIPYLTVRDNILAGTLALRLDDAPRRAGELMDRFGLTERSAHVPAQLSTGERQRVGLARALLRSPGLILADEPTGNLDDANARVVLDALAGFAAGGGAVLMATHDAATASRTHRTIELARCAAELA